MTCTNCNLPEKKWCIEYGLPSKEAILCWVTNQPLITQDFKAEANNLSNKFKQIDEATKNGTL